jgi:polyhydroxyalkanoate synthase
MPRPLPAHLASAMLLWASSRAALPSLSAGLPLSNLSPGLRDLADDLAKTPNGEVAAALDRELARRSEGFLAGLEFYRNHPYARVETPAAVIWEEGTTRLLDYGRGKGGQPVLVIPSLINRYYILDLLPGRSFLTFLQGGGFRPLVVDWGAPGEAEREFALDDYIVGRLDRILTAIGSGPVAVVGYCMGGLLALAMAARRQRDVAGLALLATPWDFHAERPEQARLIGTVIDVAASGDTLPLSVIQGLFLSLDPFLGERKFARFSQLDPASEAARDFVALEDWLNDGVPLASGVARDCGGAWYRDNAPARGQWRVAAEPIVPQRLDMPALVVVPRRDRIVPPRSAETLGIVLPGAILMRPPLGHIGMMAGTHAPAQVWQPISEWLQRLRG